MSYKILDAVKKLIMPPPHSYAFKLNKNNASRFLYLSRMFNKIKDLEGDVVECGVGKARTFQMLALLSEPLNKVLYGFDSFEGFPKPTLEDASERNPQKGEWKKLDVKDVYEGLKEIKLPTRYIENKIKIVKGFFADTLPRTEINKISFLHLDVDLYQSYKDCLFYLFPKVVNGGIVLFDEYINESEFKKFPGAKKAIDEYFAGKSSKIVRDANFGKYYLVKE